MQHNLKRGLSLTLSMMLLLGAVSACSRNANQTQTTAIEEPAHPSVTEETRDASVAERPSVSALRQKWDANPSRSDIAANRPQIDVPPPPLGIVPVSSIRRTGKSISASDTNQDDVAFDPPAPTAVRTAHRTERPVSASSHTHQTSTHHADESATAGRTGPIRSKVSFTPTRSLTLNEQASVADRRQKVREQELLAQKMVQERAAQQAQLRQARLTARRWGNARGFGVRGATQMAEKHPKQATPGWPVLVGNSK